MNKNITSVDFVENLYHLMGWNRECRYKVLGRVAASDRGLIPVFEMEEAIMFVPKKEEFVDPVTGEKNVRLNIIQMPIKTVLDGHIQNMNNTGS